MLNKVKNNIQKYNLINEGDNVILGLSGGPDSVFLFHNLRLLKEELRFNLYATHINHMYRGLDADRDEAFVSDLCNKFDTKLYVLRKNAVEYAKERKMTEEEAGRELRYNFFNEKLKEVGNGKIAVAHNLNDQAETVLQRIIRGTGLDGLKAMTFINGNIIRPILNIKRTEIEEHLNDNKLEFCTDKTNTMSIYGRNKVRLELIPYLEEKFNPNIQQTLFRLAEVSERDSNLIDEYTEELYKKAYVSKENNFIKLNSSILNNYKDYSLARIIRKAVCKLKGNTINFESKHVDYIIKFVRNPKTGRKIDLPNGLYAEISYKNLIIGKTIENISEFEYNVVINSETYIKEVNKKVLAQITNNIEGSEKDNKAIYFNYDKIEGRLKIRNRRAGDTILPIGMKGNKKIKDIFIDNKVPKYERNKKLILADDNNILWLEDFRINEKYKVNEKCQKYLKINILNIN